MRENVSQDQEIYDILSHFKSDSAVKDMLRGGGRLRWNTQRTWYPPATSGRFRAGSYYNRRVLLAGRVGPTCC